MERVGFIGIGRMGRPMCLNLRRAGYALTIFDQDREAARPVVEAGAILAASSRSVAESADVVITMLPNSSHVDDVVLGRNGVLDGAHAGLTVVDMSTIAPAMSKRVAAACAARGVGFLDAPVSGGVRGAEAGTLTIIVGGDAGVFQRVQPLLATLGAPENILHVGPAGMGAVVKLINQHLCGTIAAATLEALVLGVKAGVDAATLARVVGVSSGASWQLANPIRQRALTGAFQPGFTMDLLVKDLRLVLEMGDDLHVPLTLAAVAAEMYEAARAQGYARDDYTAVVRPLERLTGVAVRRRDG